MRANRKAAIEWAIEIVPALLLGSASAFAAAPVGPPAGAIGVGVAVAGVAWLLLARIGGVERDGWAFEPVEFPEAIDGGELYELLLDQPLGGAMAAPEPSRVVQLFGTAPLPAPGELANRITDFLEGGRSPAPKEPPSAALSSDAGAALHAALADIRRSLA